VRWQDVEINFYGRRKQVRRKQNKSEGRNKYLLQETLMKKGGDHSKYRSDDVRVGVAV